jgi:hypothetical protein
LLFLLEEFFDGTRKIQIAKKVFLRGRSPYSAVDGETAERSSISEILAKTGSDLVV